MVALTPFLAAQLTAGSELVVESFPVTGGTMYVAGSRTGAKDLVGAAMVLVPSAISQTELNTAITTVGAGTLTAAALVGGLITRSGPTSAFTDTTDTAALIQAGWAGSVGSSFEFAIINTTAFAETLAAGSGVTLAGNTIIPPNAVGRFLALWTGTNTITITNILIARNDGLPAAKFTSINATTGSLAAGAITGATFVSLMSTNATPGAQLVRTAAQMLADTPNGAVGMSWHLRITNTGAGTFTLTADGGATVTMTGTMTVPVNTTRDFIVTFNTPTTATIQSIGTGTYS